MSRRWTPDELPDLSDATVVVTGANGGLGLQTAVALAGAGAQVVLACRNLDKGEQALSRIRDQHAAARTLLLELDLASLDSVQRFAHALAERTERLDVLCNNAGVMALPYRKTADGFEMQFGTNHLGHFALTGHLLPLLLRAPRGRVVTVSSIYHRFGQLRFDDLAWERGYRKWPTYSMSKLANLLFAYELERRLRRTATRTLSVAAHPGYSATDLQHVGPRLSGATVEGAVMTLGNTLFAQSAARGAWPQIHACAAPEVRGGEYYGPRGPMELWGAPRRVESSAASHDADDAARLWEVSCQLTGMGFEALE